jgi:hypothetical protein
MCRVKMIDALASNTMLRHETSLAQVCQMGRDLRLWDAKVHDDGADGCLPLQEKQQDAPPCAVCKNLGTLYA